MTANAASFNKELQSVQRQLGAMSKGFGGISGSMSKGFNLLSGKVLGFAAAMGVAVGVASNMGDAISRLDTLNNFPKVMSNLGIGAADAQKSIQVLSDRLMGLPTSLDTAAQSVQRLTAVNKNIGASTEMFLAMNNAILAGGAPMEQQTNALEQLTQAYSKGKADAMEWRAMLSAMPAQMDQVAQAMGYTSSALGGDLHSALQSGEVSMNDFMKTVMRLDKEGVNGFQSFADQAKNSTGGVGTSIANLKISIQRALADIMNAIGQTNIASFFNTIGSAITTAGQYIAAFVRVVKEAIAWVSALFGGSGSTSGLVKETAAASDSMGGIAGGAADAEDNLGGATKQAKKLAQQLASFDEMNVLKSPEEDSGSGGGSGGSSSGGGGAFGDFSWDSALSDGEDKIGKIAEKIKAIFKDLFGDIDIMPLIKSWENFSSAASRALDGLKQIGVEFVKQFIAPVTKWAVEEALPKVFDQTATALSRIDFKKLASSAGNAFSGVASIFTSVGNVAIELYRIITDIGSWFIAFTVPPALDAIGSIFRIIGSIVNGVAKAIGELWSSFSVPVQSVINALGGMLTNLSKTLSIVEQNSDAFNVFGQILGTIIMLPVGAAIGVVVLALSALTAAVAIVNTVLEFFVGGWQNLMYALGLAPNTWEQEKQAAEANRIQKEKMKETEDALNSAKSRQIELLDELKARELESVNAEIAVINTKQRLTKAQEDLNRLTAEGKQGTDEYRLAELEVEKQTYELEAANNKLSESQDAVTKSNQELDNQKWKEYYTSKSLEAQHAIERGDYEALKKVLGDVANSGMDNVDKMQQMIGKDLSKMNTDFKSNVYNDIPSHVKDGMKAGLLAAGKSTEIGSAITEGTRQGVEQNKGGFLSSMKNLASSALSTVKSFLGIASPSKAFAEIGKYIDEGLAGGINDNSGLALDAMSDLADSLQRPILTDMELAAVNALDSLDTTVSSEIAASIQSSKIVKIELDDDMLVARVTDGQNHDSFMQNRNTIEI
jgi:tape measure domain-containing protein